MSLTPEETRRLYEEAKDEVNEALENPKLSSIKGLLATLVVYINSFVARNDAYIAFLNGYRNCMEKEVAADASLRPYVDLFPPKLSEFTVTRVMQVIRENVTNAAVHRSRLNAGSFSVYYNDALSTILACIKEGLINTRILIEVRISA